MTPAELRANIDTIAIVMMENRSFDHLLGCLRLPQYGARGDVEGLTALDNPEYANQSQNATMVAPFILRRDDVLTNDLPHSRALIADQLARSPITHGFTMTGFVRAYERATGTSGVLDPPPMSVLAPELLPVTHFFARQYTLCDRWHAPLPASTQPNRLMAMSGDVLYDDNQQGLLENQELVLDWLDRHHIRWRVYTAGFSFLGLMPKMWPALLTDRFRFLPALREDVLRESDADFPQVLWIEPDYDDLPVHLSGHANDNHPPVQVAYGEAFLKAVYDALTANPARWAKTLLIITYDEHGGFYDHVPPPPIAYAPPHGAHFDVPFTSAGVRVPALIISPFAARGGVSHLLFDHTSLLQLVAERFAPNAAGYSASVDARRSAGVHSLARALTGTGRTATPAAPDPPALPAAAGPRLRAPRTEAQHGFVAAMEGLAQRDPQHATAKYPQIRHWLDSKP